jgi:molybdopterin converting factor small subunit
MDLRVLFFGATADIAGQRSMVVTVKDDASAGAAMGSVLERFPALSGHKLLFAVNQEYISRDSRLAPGDELAIFTAVSGG